MGRKVEQPNKALVVEDETELRRLAAALLEETDLTVVEASSAEEALDYLRHHGNEVAFLFADVKLPCLMNGVELARTVQSQWPWVRTVLTSGAPLDNHGRSFPDEVRFMPKPWRALDVLVEAERACATSAMAYQRH